MVQNQSDAEVERLVQRSAAFGAVRALLLRLDASVASSTLLRAVPRRPSLAAVGLLIVIASLTHGVLVAVLPPSLAPVGRYLFAAAGVAAGVSLLVVDRWRRGA